MRISCANKVMFTRQLLCHLVTSDCNKCGITRIRQFVGVQQKPQARWKSESSKFVVRQLVGSVAGGIGGGEHVKIKTTRYILSYGFWLSSSLFRRMGMDINRWETIFKSMTVNVRNLPVQWAPSKREARRKRQKGCRKKK